MYSKQPDLSSSINSWGSPLQILHSRFRKTSKIDDFILAMPNNLNDYSAIEKEATELSVKVHAFDTDEIIEKPADILQQFWGLEDDEGHDTWIGKVFAEVATKYKLHNLILIPLINLLVSSSDVLESLTLHIREDFDACYSEERQTGANWVIFKSELLEGLNKNHPELMLTRGGLAWAMRKPLYPFKVGAFHCPRIRPKIQTDLRLNSVRSLYVYKNSQYDNFANFNFSYEEWLNTSNWEKALVAYAPQKINLEPTNVCNAKCFSCPHARMTRKQGMMISDTFSKITDFAADFSDMKFEFSGMGEPLLNPNIEKMLKSVKDFHSMLVTSLTKLPGETFPYDALNMLRISVDALEQNVFSKIRAGCNWKNIEDFLHFIYSKKTDEKLLKPLIGVTFVKHSSNEKYSQQFLNYWKQVVTPVFKQNFFRWPFDEEQSRIQWYQILGHNNILGADNTDASVSYTPVKRRPCRHALLSTTILWDGTVIACPFDYEAKYPMGNLNNKSLSEIWHSSEYAEFREQHININFPENSRCSNCQDWYHS